MNLKIKLFKITTIKMIIMQYKLNMMIILNKIAWKMPKLNFYKNNNKQKINKFLWKKKNNKK